MVAWARLEESLSEELLRKSGRRLALTDMGRLVYGYADEIFSMGREMTEALRGRPTGRAMRLVVWVADVVEKLVAERLIAPALRLPEPVRVVCREASPAQLLGALARHVETYRSHLMQKLGISDLAGLVKFAIRHGLTSLK